MFIGGLNWETTDRELIRMLKITLILIRLIESLKDYFSQFGEVQECTVMRDAATGRSRGFGFLTFKDPKTVNIVMVKEHFLDGKIVRIAPFFATHKSACKFCNGKTDCLHKRFSKIDPKRAIPRDEQEKTSKIFVGGVSQEATEQDFKEYFMQYGRVIDATLMMDKDTGRPRGFGFVTFDSEAAVDLTLRGDLRILGKPIEVKKAQPRGDMRAEEERSRRGGGNGAVAGRGKDGRFEDQPSANPNMMANQQQQQQPWMNGISPTMMAQAYSKIQTFMAMMAANNAMGNQMMGGAMGGMNPAMMNQWKMAQMQAMQQQQQQMQGRDGQNAQGGQNMQGMNPQMMPQMMMQANQGQDAGSFGNQMAGVPTGPKAGNGRQGTPGYNAQEQLAFEQQKYENQQKRLGMQGGNFNQGSPTSWEGMYDDVPQPSPPTGPSAGVGRGMNQGFVRGGHRPTGPKPSAAPANAPTGPRNAGVPGANYRGGRGGGHRANFHPYRR
jgi:RNA-binding protein Musashi